MFELSFFSCILRGNGIHDGKQSCTIGIFIGGFDSLSSALLQVTLCPFIQVRNSLKCKMLANFNNDDSDKPRIHVLLLSQTLPFSFMSVVVYIVLLPCLLSF